jgi:RES domain-containing protein
MKLGKSFFAIPVFIPDSLKIEEVCIKDLKSDWRALPPSNSTKNIGTEWVRKGSSPILRVPSIIILDEYNLVLNPKHGDFIKIKIGEAQPFTLDERIWNLN